MSHLSETVDILVAANTLLFKIVPKIEWKLATESNNRLRLIPANMSIDSTRPPLLSLNWSTEAYWDGDNAIAGWYAFDQSGNRVDGTLEEILDQLIPTIKTWSLAKKEVYDQVLEKLPTEAELIDTKEEKVK